MCECTGIHTCNSQSIHIYNISDLHCLKHHQNPKTKEGDAINHMTIMANLPAQTHVTIYPSILLVVIGDIVIALVGSQGLVRLNLVSS